jgi:hypothetical protein
MTMKKIGISVLAATAFLGLAACAGPGTRSTTYLSTGVVSSPYYRYGYGYPYFGPHYYYPYGYTNRYRYYGPPPTYRARPHYAPDGRDHRPGAQHRPPSRSGSGNHGGGNHGNNDHSNDRGGSVGGRLGDRLSR